MEFAPNRFRELIVEAVAKTLDIRDKRNKLGGRNVNLRQPKESFGAHLKSVRPRGFIEFPNIVNGAVPLVAEPLDFVLGKFIEFVCPTGRRAEMAD
jgi:hypothetical protein